MSTVVVVGDHPAAAHLPEQLLACVAAGGSVRVLVPESSTYVAERGLRAITGAAVVRHDPDRPWAAIDETAEQVVVWPATERTTAAVVADRGAARVDLAPAWEALPGVLRSVRTAQSPTQVAVHRPPPPGRDATDPTARLTPVPLCELLGLDAPVADGTAATAALRSGLRVAVRVSGSYGAIDAPRHLAAVRRRHPELELRVLLSPIAATLVRPSALARLLDAPVAVDSFDEQTGSFHVELAEWADALAVCPASLRVTGAIAACVPTSPFELAACYSPTPLGLALGLPPDAGTHSRVVETIARARRHGTTVLDPMAGRSAFLGRETSGAAAPLGVLLDAMADAAPELTGATG